MTYAEFLNACQMRTIDINVALEDEEIKKALKNKDDEKVIKLLDRNF